MAWEHWLDRLQGEGPRPGVLASFRGGQYTVRTRLPSSWKGHGTQEGTGEGEQVTLREETVLFRGGKGR